MVRIQIDNSLSLGWSKDDILLAANFEYEYNGVKSLVIGDENYCPFHWPATKVYVLVTLFQMGAIQDGTYWYHDFDCFQLVPFGQGPDLGTADMGLTNYGRMPRLCSASIFFKETAADILWRLKQEVDQSRKGEEEGMARMLHRDEKLQERVRLLNITWAFHRFNLRSCWRIADQPVKAAHFHLTPDKYAFYVDGDNKLNLPIIPDRLVNIFHNHGWRRDTIWQ